MFCLILLSANCSQIKRKIIYPSPERMIVYDQMNENVTYVMQVRVQNASKPVALENSHGETKLKVEVHFIKSSIEATRGTGVYEFYVTGLTTFHEEMKLCLEMGPDCLQVFEEEDSLIL